MLFYSKTLRKAFKQWPGEKIFGLYRFLPIFFVAGALLEFSMIKWHVGEVNFYKIYKKRVVSEMVEERLQKELQEKL